jgi:hypothetical protein
MIGEDHLYTVSLTGGSMPRLYEIETACRKAIDILPNGKRILTTRRFLQELERYNGTGRHGRLTSG